MNFCPISTTNAGTVEYCISCSTRRILARASKGKRYMASPIRESIGGFGSLQVWYTWSHRFEWWSNVRSLLIFWVPQVACRIFVDCRRKIWGMLCLELTVKSHCDLICSRDKINRQHNMGNQSLQDWIWKPRIQRFASGASLFGSGARIV